MGLYVNAGMTVLGMAGFAESEISETNLSKTLLRQVKSVELSIVLSIT